MPRVAIIASAFAGLMAVLMPATAAFGATSVPYTDPAAVGSINFCNASGQPVMGGSLDASPFVVRASASAPAPTDYQGAGQRASLWVYVPVQGESPSQWSGQALTGATQYLDTQAPTAIGTSADTSLSLPLQNVPPRWDGLVQIRMIYSIPNRGTAESGYAATDIQVSGNNWSVIRGGGSRCSTATAVSDESFVPGLLSPAPTFVPAYINGRPNPKAFPHGVPTGSTAPFYDPDDGDSPSASPRTSAGAAAPTSAQTTTASTDGTSDQAGGSGTSASGDAVTPSPPTATPIAATATRAAAQSTSKGLPGWLITLLVAAALAVGAFGTTVVTRLRGRT